MTGGAGFIGSHLCEALANLGQQVNILDNLSSGSRENIRQAKSAGRVRLLLGDCKNPKDVWRAVSKADIVYHFAANPEVRLDLANPSTCFRENIYATQLLLEAFRRTDAQTIVFASTSTIYGDAQTIPTPEDYSPLEPISVYGASKLASEALITAYCHTYKRRAVILRLANIVGPKSSRGVINDFIAQLKRNPRQLEILGDGQQKKSYLHIDDCTDAILRASETAREPIEIFNVGSDDQIEVSRIARMVVDELELKDVEFTYTGGVDGGRGWVGDVKNMLLDTRKLKSKGWAPRHSSEEAVTLTVRAVLGEDVER